MGTVLGLTGLTIYIVATICLAAAVTWGVVKLSPSNSQNQLDAKKSSAQ